MNFPLIPRRHCRFHDFSLVSLPSAQLPWTTTPKMSVPPTATIFPTSTRNRPPPAWLRSKAAQPCSAAAAAAAAAAGASSSKNSSKSSSSSFFTSFFGGGGGGNTNNARSRAGEGGRDRVINTSELAESFAHKFVAPIWQQHYTGTPVALHAPASWFIPSDGENDTTLAVIEAERVFGDRVLDLLCRSEIPSIGRKKKNKNNTSSKAASRQQEEQQQEEENLKDESINNKQKAKESSVEQEENAEKDAAPQEEQEEEEEEEANNQLTIMNNYHAEQEDVERKTARRLWLHCASYDEAYEAMKVISQDERFNDPFHFLSKEEKAKKLQNQKEMRKRKNMMQLEEDEEEELFKPRDGVGLVFPYPATEGCCQVLFKKNPIKMQSEMEELLAEADLYGVGTSLFFLSALSCPFSGGHSGTDAVQISDQIIYFLTDDHYRCEQIFLDDTAMNCPARILENNLKTLAAVNRGRADLNGITFSLRTGTNLMSSATTGEVTYDRDFQSMGRNRVFRCAAKAHSLGMTSLCTSSINFEQVDAIGKLDSKKRDTREKMTTAQEGEDMKKRTDELLSCSPGTPTRFWSNTSEMHSWLSSLDANGFELMVVDENNNSNVFQEEKFDKLEQEFEEQQTPLKKAEETLSREVKTRFVG